MKKKTAQVNIKLQTPVPVYFMQLGHERCPSRVVRDMAKEIRGDELYFVGGGWCYLQDCYLTERQCRRANRMQTPVTPTLRKLIIRACDLMENLVHQLREQLRKDTAANE